MVIRGTSNPTTPGSVPYAFAPLDKWGGAPISAPPGVTNEDVFGDQELTEEQKEALRRFVEAHQDQFQGTIDTPQELKKLLQMLHQGEGKDFGLPKLETKPGQDLNGLNTSEMLQALADYLANYGSNKPQQQPRPPKMLGNLNGNGGGSGGGSGSAGPSGGSGGGGPSSAASSADTGPATNTASLKGNKNAEKAFNYFLSKGLTKEQAAGIVGNLVEESGVDPTRAQENGGPARGIAQWEGSRLDGLRQFARQQGKSPEDFGVQLDYIWKELNSTESASFAALKRTTTASQAAVVFVEKFERAGIPRTNERIQSANNALGEFGGGSSALA